MQDIDQYSLPDFKVELPPSDLFMRYPEYSLTKLLDAMFKKPKFETYYNKINEENSSVLQRES